MWEQSSCASRCVDFITEGLGQNLGMLDLRVSALERLASASLHEGYQVIWMDSKTKTSETTELKALEHTVVTGVDHEYVLPILSGWPSHQEYSSHSSISTCRPDHW